MPFIQNNQPSYLHGHLAHLYYWPITVDASSISG